MYISLLHCMYVSSKQILVTSNDSRIRMYDLRDLTLTCKYKGCVNNSSQIKASFRLDKYVIMTYVHVHCTCSVIRNHVRSHLSMYTITPSDSFDSLVRSCMNGSEYVHVRLL